MTSRSFATLRLAEPIQRALIARGYAAPTPIQAQAIPHLLAGRDLLGIAQTGTGKTAAFALPILQILASSPRRPAPRAPRALVLTPTRELAAQIEDSFSGYGQNLHLRLAVVFGGVGQDSQVRALRPGLDVLVATPGRLLDLIGQGHADLRHVEIFVLDEADRMLDMGFLPDVRRIIGQLPKNRQSLLFSATMPSDIVQLAGTILRDPVRVEVAPQATTVERVRQSVILVEKPDKPGVLAALLQDPSITSALVFTRTRHGADRVAKSLRKQGIRVEAIHGDKSQSARERALDGFRAGSILVLVATDIAARGIDVPGITHVINYDLPNIPESYVHRIGRTARAGREGTAISFCGSDERPYLRDIEKLIRCKIPVIPGPAPLKPAPESKEPAAHAPARHAPRPVHPPARHHPHTTRGPRHGTPARPQRHGHGPAHGHGTPAKPQRHDHGHGTPARRPAHPSRPKGHGGRPHRHR